MSLSDILNALIFNVPFYSHEKLRIKLKNKKILLTGASYGIGEALVYRLSNIEGISLVLIARTVEKLSEIKYKAEASGAKVEFFALDLRDEEQRSYLIQEIKKQEIDFFINNAGHSINRSIFDSLDRFHDFKRLISLNYEAAVELTLALIPSLVLRKGQILNISAVNLLFQPAPKWAAYQASKAAFDQFLRSIEPELRTKEVICSSIYFPLVKTRMIKPSKNYENTPAMTIEQAVDCICARIVDKKSIYKPWWIFPIELISVLFRKTWSQCYTWFLKY